MAEKSTFIKIDRNITEWRWYKDSNTFRVFLHLIVTANFKPYEFENVTIERGQVATSHERIANTLNLTIQQVRTALGHLKATGEITAKTYRRFQVISIVNYDLYQGTSTGTSTGYQQADNTLITPYQQQYKNDKESKNEKERKEYIDDSAEPATQPESKGRIRHKHGEYNNVLLTDEELEKLKAEYPDYQERIERLSGYIASTGKKYASHYATIRAWARKEQPNADTTTKTEPKRYGGTYL